MKESTRRKHTDEFKAKVAIDAFREQSREVAILYQSTPVAGDYTKMYLMQREGIRASFSHDFGTDPHIADFADLRQMLIENEINRDEAEPAFFYHSDHLGSAAYLTRDGHVTQTLNYLPYGEDWVELNFLDPIDTTRIGIYRFNGKEKDYESGFHYYGARFYWSELNTGWISVDPMMDKYPSISPYAYCAWNPIIFVDPNGMIIDSTSLTDKTKAIIQSNPTFANACDALAKDPENTYSFNKWDKPKIENDRQINGEVTFDGEKVFINYIETSDNFALFEEVGHAQQVISGDIGIILPNFRTSA